MRVVALVAVAFLVGVGAAGSDARARTASCKTKGATVVANARARVYRVPVSKTANTGYRVYACLLRPKHTVYLGGFDFEALGVMSVSLNGPSVAFEKADCDKADCRGAIKVRNLRTGVTRQSPIPSGANLADMVLASADGSVAWTRKPNPDVVEVRALGADGEQLLDSGPDVDPESLALAGSTVYWTKGGQPRSAPLP
jgi:hypothetical protein